MKNSIRVTKLYQHSPQFGWADFSDGKDCSYGRNADGHVWITLMGTKCRSKQYNSGPRVEAVKLALQADS